MRVQVEHQFFGQRIGIIVVFALIMFSVLSLRLYYLQGIQGAHFRDLSENNRTRTVRTAPPRGTMYDRNGTILVRNRPEFNVALLLEDIRDVPGTLQRLSEISGAKLEDLQAALKSVRRNRPFEPKIVLSDISWEQLARIKGQIYQLPGVIVEVKPTRFYPHQSLGAQLFGYTREISKSQLEKLGEEYAMGDMVGQTGLEQSYEESLRGRSGYRRVEVDAMGNRRSELGLVDSVSGKDLVLSIDVDLQRAAEEALAPEKGAVVALDPRTGEVLVLASMPTFDANIFSGEIHREEWKTVSTDKRHPLNNRAISAAYAPGSTFKLIMAVAGLAEKKITPQTTFYCPGYYHFAGRNYRCHKKSGHGTVDLNGAVIMSCDSYFYQLGQLLGINKIHDYGFEFGLGQKLGIPLEGEKAGTLPSEKWKLSHLGQRWYPGETLSVSIGQGYLTTTPLAMATAMATIANGGTLYQPYVVREIVDPVTGEKVTTSPTVLKKLDIDQDILGKVRGYAIGVVEDARGTGHKAAITGISVGGKTGTAQVVSLGKEGLGKHLNDHAWFIAFAPADNPTIAIAVIVENGGHGGARAAPVSKAVMSKYFEKLGMIVSLNEGSSSSAVADGSASSAAGDDALAD